MKHKYSIKQVRKYVNQATNKIAFKFEFLRGGHPIKIADVPKPKLDPNTNVPILDKDNKLQYEMVPVYRTLELEFDPGVPKSTITSLLKRQILELQLQDEARVDGPAKLEDAPDIGEITSDDLTGLDLVKIKKKVK